MSDSLYGLLPDFYTLTITDQQGCTSVWTFEVKYTSATNETENITHLLIYPNPALQSTTLEVHDPKALEPAWLDLYDATGRKIRSFTMPKDAGKLIHQIP